MSYIASLAAIVTVIMSVGFAAFMVKELFTSR